MKQSSVLKLNLGGDEMGKQEDVMILQSTEMRKKEKRKTDILQGFQFELSGMLWPVSRIIQQNSFFCQRIGIYVKMCPNMVHKQCWRLYILFTVVLVSNAFIL